MKPITEDNYTVIKAQINAIRNQLKKEFERNHRSILDLQKRQEEIKQEYLSLIEETETIGEFELKSELKFLELIERKCERCGNIYDIRNDSEKLCPACFTSNS